MKVIPIPIQAGISGFESPAAEYKELGLSLDQLLISNADATYFGLAQGESMVEAGIFDGDILLIDRSIDVVDGDVIVANYNGCFTCKLIDIKHGLLISASPKHSSVKISPDDEFQKEGVVICSFRLHRKVKELSACMG